MEADLIDDYIAKFENLLAKGGIPCTVPQKTDQMFSTFALFWWYLNN